MSIPARRKWSTRNRTIVIALSITVVILLLVGAYIVFRLEDGDMRLLTGKPTVTPVPTLDMSPFKGFTCEIGGLTSPQGVWQEDGQVAIVTPTNTLPTYYQMRCDLPPGTYEVFPGCAAHQSLAPEPMSNVAIIGRFVVQNYKQGLTQARIIVLCPKSLNITTPLSYIGKEQSP